MNSKREDYMCCIFSERDAKTANGKFDWTMVREYGSRCAGHALHTWDWGERFLVKCKNCGKLLLIQDSEYHGISYTDDSDYRDIYPVKSEEEAETLNREYDGFSLERDLKRRALYIWNGEPFWHGD